MLLAFSGSTRWKYFSISRVMGPSAVRHTAPLFRILDTRASLMASPRVSLRKSSTGLLSSAFCSRAAFSSSVSGRASASSTDLKATSSTAPRASMTNWSGSSVR